MSDSSKLNGSKLKECDHGDKTQEPEDIIKSSRIEGYDNLVSACKGILVNIGEDIEREGLEKTPERMAKAFSFFTSGYETKLKGMNSLNWLPDGEFRVKRDFF